MMRPMFVRSRLLLAVVLVASLTGCSLSRDDPATSRSKAGAPSGTDAATPTSVPCDETALSGADALRLDAYRAALGHILRASDDRPAVYLTDHPVPGRDVPVTPEKAFSTSLLSCLTAGDGDLPRLLPVAGFTDPKVVKQQPGGRAARLARGRLVELSGLAVDGLTRKALVFVSVNGGGGFDYIDAVVQVEATPAGPWTVTKVLKSGIA